MKNKFLLTCALLGVLTMSGCKNKEETIKATLTAPDAIEVKVDSNGRSYIIFDEVEGAEYYNVSINGNVVTVRANGTGQIQFDASKLMGEPKDYAIKVNAGGSNYFESDFTDVYNYSTEQNIESPIVTLDGTTLNWSKVTGADVYEILVETSSTKQIYKSIHNSFDFEDMLTICGEYNFSVIAVSQNKKSEPSNQITYRYTKTLITPYNLKVEYDYNENEEVLAFVSSVGVEAFDININNQNFEVNFNGKDASYWKNCEFDNVYMFRIKAYAINHGISIDNGALLNVKVKAKASIAQTYLNNSQFSQSATYQVKSVLDKPEISINTVGNMCNLQISANNSQYLSQFVIYLNHEEYKRVDSSVRSLQISKDMIGNKSICVQSISNNNSCYNSNFSEMKFVDGSSATITLTSDNSVITWNNISGSSGYLLEISNSKFRVCQNIDGGNTSFDISTLCEPGEYSVKIISLGKSGEGQANVRYCNQLEVTTNLLVDKDSLTLKFDEVQGSDGYRLTIKNYSPQTDGYIEKVIPYLFDSSPIDISDYLLEAQDYEFKLEAVSLLNKYVDDSFSSAEVTFENVKTLAAPIIAIVENDGRYYLTVTQDNSAEAVNYEVWIDYIEFKDIVINGRLDVTEYLQNAGLHNFRVKAKAVDNKFLRDSNVSSLQYPIYKQLDEVKNINVDHISDESKYILSFDGQTMAGQYNVKIIKADDNFYNVEFSTNSSMVDITKYITENGTYKIYIQAIARQDDAYYRNSVISGNPGTISKGVTLKPVSNINVSKDKIKDKINLTWSSVANSEYYRVQVYYNTGVANVLKQTITVPQSNGAVVSLDETERLAIDKEGSYTIEIKAIGNDIYESSTIATGVYNHQMETVGDFERNTTTFEGKTYSYKVDSLDTLKNLLWKHYLYNNEIGQLNTFDYNLKVYCDLDLDELAQQVSDDVKTAVEAASGDSSKMNILAIALMDQYKEIVNYDLIYDNSMICINTSKNIFIFRYQTDLPQTQTTETDNAVYGEKVDVVSKFNKRFSSYKFAIDGKDSVEVTTTEQLFMALQYGKQPKFVGDSDIAEAVYENARYVLRQICSDNMTEYEKVLQIYNFLTKRVAWNYEAETMLTNINDSSGLQELYLESILYNSNKTNGLFTTISETYNNNQISKLDEFKGVSSLSQGLSKAFVVLCSIEGIDSIKVNGKLDGKDYSWNKVYIDVEDDDVDEKQWYAIDLGSAIKNKWETGGAEYQVSTHKYFLVKDLQIKASQTSCHQPLGDISYDAVTEYNYYDQHLYESEYGGKMYSGNMSVVSGEDIKGVIKHAMISANGQKVIIDVDASVYFETIGGSLDSETIWSKIQALHMSAVDDIGIVYDLSITIVDERYIVFAFKPHV